MNTEIMGRFAPSPSGYLHVGNLLAMLLAWLDIRSQGGTILFRMEDLDPARSKAEYINAMADDLLWLGLDWDGGWPADESFRQSRRTLLYDRAFHTLQDKGLVYPCWCTRADRLAAVSAPHPGEQIIDSRCRCSELNPSQYPKTNRDPAWKLRSPRTLHNIIDQHYGLIVSHPQDFILRRSDGVYAYQLAVCEDDRLMGINRVVRGRDLITCSPQQAWLTQMLGGTPPTYCHSPLLTDGDHKLSKRYGSLSTAQLRKTITPEQLTGALACVCGLIPEYCKITPKDLIPEFSWDKVCKDDIPLERLISLLQIDR